MFLACALCFCQFTLQIHEANVDANTTISFDKFLQPASRSILAFASLHLFLLLHLRHKCVKDLGQDNLIEQNDIDTTRIIAYALSFIIYANA